MAWAKGLGLGALNVFVVAVLMAAIIGDSAVVLLVILIGSVPGIATGACLGLLAGIIKTYPRTLRAVLLTVPAVGVLIGLAACFACSELVPATAVPTIVAALFLEHCTRQVASPPPIPVASVQRG